MKSLFRALHYTPFALLWGGQTVSRLGDNFYQVALAWWVLEKTGSAAVMGTMLICSTVPLLLFSLVGGAMVDRWPRVPILLASDTLRCAITTAMAGLVFANKLEVWQVYVLSAAFGLVDAFFQPAYRAALPEVVPHELLTSANSLNSLSLQVSGILGPSLAAGLIAWGGTGYAFAFDAFSFFTSALCLIPVLRFGTAALRSAAGPNVFQDIREGFGIVFGSPWLWITIGVAGISNVTYAGPMGVALPFLIKERFHANVQVLGYFYTCMSAGAVLGALVLGHQLRIRKRGLKMYGVWMLIGLAVALMAAPLPVYFMLAAALLVGSANTMLGLIWVNSLQELVPREAQGRVSSIDYLGSSILEPAGYAVGGWATAALGPAAVFVIGGLLQTLLIGLGLLDPQVRGLD